MDRTKHIWTAFLVAALIGSLSSAWYIHKIETEIQAIYNQTKEIETNAIAEVPAAAEEVPTKEHKIVNITIQKTHTFAPDKLTLKLPNDSFAVITIPENFNKATTFSPKDDIAAITKLCFARIISNDIDIPKGIHTVNSATGQIYITAVKRLNNKISLMIGMEDEAEMQAECINAVQSMLDSIVIAETVDYCYENKQVNADALEQTVFSPYCIGYDGEHGIFAVQEAAFELPVSGYNKAQHLGNWIVYSGIFQDDIADTELFLVDTGTSTLKVVAADIETLYWFFDTPYEPEKAYDATILGSDILEKLTTNHVGNLNGLNFFVPQKMPEHDTADVTAQQVSGYTDKSIAVRSGQKIWLELAGGTIDCTQKNGYAILVEKGGELIISGNGKIVNSNGKAAVLNEGTCYISGDIEIESNSGDYAIVNHGTMELGANVSVKGAESVLYVIDNGFHNKSSYERTERNQSGDTVTPDLRIYGGTYYGSGTVLQNEEDGYLYVYGGTFENDTNDSVLIGNKGNIVEIADGNFNFGGSLFELGQRVPSEASAERTYILGGKFEVTSFTTTHTHYLIKVPTTLTGASNFELAHGPIYILGGEVLGINKYYSFLMDKDAETPLTISEIVYFGQNEIYN